MGRFDRMARRFPLVAGTRPACPPLEVRVREVCDTACAAAVHGGSDSLTLAATALNRAALVASDCGMSEFASTLCWRHVDVYRPWWPLGARAARLALEPVVNLARLRIRENDGSAAYGLLGALYRATRAQADAVIDGVALPLSMLARDAEAHASVCQWLWAVLLADGTRALTRAGRWRDALAHVEWHGGMGLRLLDGRQVAVVARCAEGDVASALALIEQSVPSEPWERAVSSCLTALCLQSNDDEVAPPAITTAAGHYLGLHFAPELLAFRTRLGVTIIELAAGARQPCIADITTRLMTEALAAGDGYAARDLLASDRCRSLLHPAQARGLSKVIDSAGLGRGDLPARLLTDLTSAVYMAEDAATQALASGGANI